jgi:hypothetical protein
LALPSIETNIALEHQLCTYSCLYWLQNHGGNGFFRVRHKHGGNGFHRVRHKHGGNGFYRVRHKHEDNGFYRDTNMKVMDFKE